MKIVLRSRVNCRFEEVSENFGQELFEFLLPPKFMARLIRYDGSRPGSVVHIRFQFPYPSDWISIIKNENKSADKYFFVDEGEKLPFGLKNWKHLHMVVKVDYNTTEIIDEMTFSTGFKLLDMLAYPVLLFAFYPRKKQYKQFFER